MVRWFVRVWVAVTIVSILAGIVGFAVVKTVDTQRQTSTSKPTSPSTSPRLTPGFSVVDYAHASGALLLLNALPFGTVALPPSNTPDLTCEPNVLLSPVHAEAQFRLPSNDVLFEAIDGGSELTIDALLGDVHHQLDCGSVADSQGGLANVGALSFPFVAKQQLAYQIVDAPLVADIVFVPLGAHALLSVMLTTRDRQPDPSELARYAGLALARAQS